MKLKFEREKITPSGLGIGRILYFATIFLTVSAPTAFGNFSGQQCATLMGVWFELHISSVQAQILATAFQTATLFAMIGFLTRLSMAVAFLALFLLNMNALQFCYYNHQILPVHIGMFLWLLLDRQSGFRADRWLAARIWWPHDRSARIDEWCFPFLMRAYFAIAFFLSAVTKLRVSGWEWVFSDSLKNMLIVQNFEHEGFWLSRGFVDLNAWVVSVPYLTIVLAGLTIVAELAAPLTLFKSKIRNWIVFELAAMQVGVFVLMYVDFKPWLVLYIFWLPLNRWGQWLQSKMPTQKLKAEVLSF